MGREREREREKFENKFLDCKKAKKEKKNSHDKHI